MSDSPPWGGQADQPPAGSWPPSPGGPGYTPPGYGPPGYGGPGYAPPGYGPPGYGGPGYAPPDYGPPGYGGPGYGAPGWPTLPPAPAPGGVPLRPLAVGDILSGAFTLIRRNPLATLGLAAIIETISAVFTTYVSWTNRRLARQLIPSPQETPAQLSHAMGQYFQSLIPYLLLTIGISVLVQTVLTGTLTWALGQGLLGKKVTIGEAWRMARVPAVLGFSVLSGLIMIGLFVPVVVVVLLLALAKATVAAVLIGIFGYLGTIVALIFIYVRLSLAVPAIVLEAAGPVAAIRRSWQLVRGSWWRIFGISLLALLIVTLVSFALRIPFSLVSAILGGSGGPFGLNSATAAAAPSMLALVVGSIGGIVASTCTQPIRSGVTVLLYTDMRIRKEGLDLMLAQGAQADAMTSQDFRDLWQPGSGQRPFPGAGPGTAGGAGPGAMPGAGPGSPSAW